MKFVSKYFFYQFGFRQQLILTLTLGILFLSGITSIATISVSRSTVYQQLEEQGQNITENFAKQSTLSLLYKSPENAFDAIGSTLAFSDVLAIGIYGVNGDVLIERGEIDFLPKKHAGPEILETYNSEDSYAWHFVAPVYTEPGEDIGEESPFSLVAAEREYVGYVQVVVGKNTLYSMQKKIVARNVSITIALAMVLLLLLLTITARLTQPLKELASIMGRAEGGEYTVRARLFGSKDVQNMEVAFNTMISELEKRELELERARDTALALAQIKGEFAANVTHELRTPMNGVMGMLQLLGSTKLTSEQNKYVQIARSSGDSLLSLIDEILDFSKLESGKITVHPVAFDPHEMANDISELLRPQASKKGLKIEYSCAINLPSLINADAARIRQVLINLAGNAIKFTHNGGVYIQLLAAINEDGSRSLEISVRDTGIGIANEALKRIFEAFAQVDGSITRDYGGTGLGLAISKQLVELMGGSIHVSSIPGKESVFSFSIPFDEAHELESLDGDGSDCENGFANLNVLVAVSDVEKSRWLEQTLGEWDCSTSVVHSTLEALTEMHIAVSGGHSVDLLVTEGALLNMSADNLLRQFDAHQIVPSPMVIMLADDGSPVEDLPPESFSYYSGPLEKAHLAHEVSQQQVSREKRLIIQAQLSRAPAQDQHSRHILVAEDNRTNQYVVLGMLEELGYTADIAVDGKEAVTAVMEGNYGLVLMDCVMPGMDGFEATKKIRQFAGVKRDIPIVALTANTGSDADKICLAAGMNDYMEKPIDMKLLEEKLCLWLDEDIDIMPEKDACQAEEYVEELGIAPVDMSELHTLRDKIGSRYISVIRVYIEDALADIDRIEGAEENHDMDVIKNTAHRLKGSSLNIGAKPMADICKKIELASENRNMGNLQALIAQAKEEFVALETALQGEFAQTKEPKTQVNEKASVILIADDDRSARLTLLGALEAEGYKLLQAENGKEALDICRYARPDLVLLDVMMPVMDGFSACGEILDLQPGYNPPILMITALHDDAAIEKAFAAGATDFVTKPANLSVIRQRIARLLKTNKTEKHVHQLAYYDPLTNLPNRTQFVQRTTEMINLAEKNGTSIALLFLDLDRFKFVNDSLSHDAGDSLLSMVAERLVKNVRRSDLVARFGGDEFTVSLDGVTGPDLSAKIAQKICRSLAEPYIIRGKKVFISGSIGIALYPDHGDTLQSLMKEADTAMYRAKAQGGGCFRFFEEGMEHELLDRMELEAELRVAIDNNQLEIFYQPQSDLNSDTVTGVEALLRWHNPVRGMVSPAEFIPLAEESGLITSIGDWVLENACLQLRQWLDQGVPPLTMAINISKHQMRAGDLQSRVADILAQLELPPELIKLEITESAIEGDPEGMMDLLNEIHATGVTLAIDDFGTGYSSLSYLKRFPLDTLKIDMSFIKDITDDSDSRAIVAGIIALGHSLRMKLIAEGVETEAQRELLKQLTCDQMQGYLLGKPMPNNEFVDWIQQCKVHS